MTNKFKLSTNSKLKFLIIGLISISSLFAILGYWIFIHFEIKLTILCMFGYGAFYCIYQKLFGRIKRICYITWIVNIPLILIGLASKLAHPAMIVFGAIFFPLFMIASITLIIIYCIEYLANITFSNHTILFILLTISEIICVHIPKITNYCIKNSPLKNWENHKYEVYNEDLALYISSPKNFNFIFSVLYAIFLTINAFYQLEYHSFLFSADIDNAILKSFLVFLAFTAMKQKSKDIDINTKDLLEKITGLFSHDEQNLKKQ